MIDQIFISIFGVSAIALSQSTDVKKARFACIFGLIGQPFWFWSSYVNETWGIFFLSFLYTLAWSRGVYNHWIK